MVRARRAIEDDGQAPRLILSMRTKLALGCVLFFLAMGLIAYANLPNGIRALGIMARGEPPAENESHPPEQDTPSEQAPPEQKIQSSAQEEGPPSQVDVEASFVPFKEGDRMILFRDNFIIGWFPWEGEAVLEAASRYKPKNPPWSWGGKNPAWSWEWSDTTVTIESDGSTHYSGSYGEGNPPRIDWDWYLFLDMEKERTEQITAYSFYSKEAYSPPVVLEVLLRCSDDNKLGSDQGVGRKLWGWGPDGVLDWDEYGPCFISISPESEHPLPGLWVGHFSYPETWIPIEGIDITEWHTYTIIIEDMVPDRSMECNTTFLVDGEVVANVNMPIRRSSTRGPWGIAKVPWGSSEMYATFSLDNAFYQTDDQGRPRRGGGSDKPVDQWIQIDYVDIFMGNEAFDAVEDMNGMKREEFAEVSLIFSRTQELINELEERSMDSTRLDGRYDRARDVWLETIFFWESVFWERDLDYNQPQFSEAANELDTFVGRLEDILKDWDEIDALLSQAETVINDARQQRADDFAVSFLEELNAKAKGRWARLDVGRARMSLEAILDTSTWQDVTPDFEAASGAIAKAEEMDTHPGILSGMKANYEYAISFVVAGDHQRADTFLQHIVDAAEKYFEIDVSEPVLLPILGLVLLALLTRRRMLIARRMLIVRHSFLLALVLLSVPIAVHAEANKTIIFEEFDDYDTARKDFPPYSSPYTVQDGYACLNVPLGSTGSSALMSQRSWRYVGFEVRLQNHGDPEGFREIGFFGGGIRLRWEWLCDESDPEFQGLHATCAHSGKTLIHEPVETDIQDSHVYTIIWEPNNVSFLLDGVVVAHTDQTPKSSLELYVGVKPICVLGTLDNWRTNKIELASDQTTKMDLFNFEWVTL